MHIRLFMEHQSGRLHGGWTNTCGGKTSSKTSKTSQHLLILGHRTSPGSTKSVWKNCSGREASSQYSNKHLYISDMFSYLISDLEWTTLTETLYLLAWLLERGETTNEQTQSNRLTNTAEEIVAEQLSKLTSALLGQAPVTVLLRSYHRRLR